MAINFRNVLLIGCLLWFPAVLTAEESKDALKLRQQKITLSLAQSLFNDRQYEQSLAVFRDFIEIYPDSPYLTQALETMADIYEKIQRYKEALQVYRRLYQEAGMTSQGLKYYYNQGRLLFEMGEVEIATKIFMDIVELSPDSPYAKKAKIQLQLNEALP